MKTWNAWLNEKVEPISKEEAYEKGLYQFEVPPVSTRNWDYHSWIKWIDSNGKWLVPVLENQSI